MSGPPPTTTATPGTKRVIFVDFAAMKYNAVTTWLAKDGVESETLLEGPKFLSRISEEAFDVCVVNLMVGGTGPFELVSRVRQTSKNPEIKLIVISRQIHRLNIQNTMRAGADDFVGEPYENENLYHRILYHLTPKRVIQSGSYEGIVTSPEALGYLNLLLEAVEQLGRAERSDGHAVFVRILKGLADKLDSNRTSLIIVESDTDSDKGVVLATSDDPNFQDFPITLAKYPEVLHVLHSGNFVLIDDVSQNALTDRINQTVRTIKIGSVMVFPIRFQGNVMGAMTIRRPKATELPAMDIMRVVAAIANTMGSHSNTRGLLRKIYKDFAEKKQTA